MGEKHSSSGDLTTEGICVFENVQLYSITYMYYCNTEVSGVKKDLHFCINFTLKNSILIKKL